MKKLQKDVAILRAPLEKIVDAKYARDSALQCLTAQLNERDCEISELQKRVADYEEMHEDHKRLVREIDEIISGKEGMAKQASLCDLVHPIQELQNRLSTLEKERL